MEYKNNLIFMPYILCQSDLRPGLEFVFVLLKHNYTCLKYSKTCVKQQLKKRQIEDLNDKG